MNLIRAESLSKSARKTPSSYPNVHLLQKIFHMLITLLHCKNIWVTSTILWLSQLHACCVCDTSGEATSLILNQSVVEKLLPSLNFKHWSVACLLCAWHDTKECFLLIKASPSMRIFLQKAYRYLVTLLAFLPQSCNQGTPPGADV